MLNNSTISFKGVIDLSKKLITGLPNTDYRKLTLTDQTDLTGITLTELVGYFVVKDPFGAIVHQGNFDSPDIVHDDSLVFDEIEIPLDSLGNILNGTYTIQYFVQRTVGMVVTSYHSPIVEFLVCNTSCAHVSTPVITLDINCDSGYAQGVDATEYESGSTVERRLLLRPPVGSKYSNGNDAPDYTSTAVSVTSDALWSKTWEFLLRAVCTHTVVTGNFTFQTLEYLEASTSQDASCDINLCGLYGCINDELAKIKTQAASYGGIGNNVLLQDRVNLILMEAFQMQLARQCRNRTKVSFHYNNIKEILSCTCGCSDSPLPTLIEPIIPTANNVVVQGSNPVVVTPVTVGSTTTYTVSLSSIFIATIVALKIVAITSSDETIDVDSNTVSDTTTWDLVINVDKLGEKMLEKIDPSCLELEDATFYDVLQELIARACEPPPPPVAVNDAWVMVENTTIQQLPTYNDFGSTSLTTTITVAPENGTAVLQDNGEVLYTPNEDFVGTDSFEYQIEDTFGQTSTATVTIVVNAVTPATCAVINASCVADVQIEGTTVTVVLSNQTNYEGNTPDTVQYFVEVRDEDDLAIHVYSPVAGENTPTPLTIDILPNELAANWHHIAVTMWVTSKDADGNSCGTVIYDLPSPILISDIGLSIFSGVDVSCLDLGDAPTDAQILQALVDNDCNGEEATNGLHGFGTEANSYKLGGTLIEDTTINADDKKVEINDAKTFSILSGGAVSDGAYTKNESSHVVSNFNNPSGYVIHECYTESEIENYTLTNGHAIVNKQNAHTVVLKSDVTSGDLGNGSILGNVIDTFKVDSDGDDYSLTQNQGSGRRVIVNRLFNTQLSPRGTTNKATIGKYANVVIASNAEDEFINEWNEFIQLFVRNCKGGGAITGNDTDMPNNYGIYQEGTDDKNVFYGEIEYHGALTNASDERSKDIIGDYENGLDVINKIIPKVFTKKKGFGKQGIEMVGIIAQELEKIIPSAISQVRQENMEGTVIEDFKTIDQNYIMFAMLNAIKELSKEVTELKKSETEKTN